MLSPSKHERKGAPRMLRVPQHDSRATPFTNTIPTHPYLHE
jgi:hypothetical protein